MLIHSIKSYIAWLEPVRNLFHFGVYNIANTPVCFGRWPCDWNTQNNTKWTIVFSIIKCERMESQLCMNNNNKKRKSSKRMIDRGNKLTECKVCLKSLQWLIINYYCRIKNDELVFFEETHKHICTTDFGVDCRLNVSFSKSFHSYLYANLIVSLLLLFHFFTRHKIIGSILFLLFNFLSFWLFHHF